MKTALMEENMLRRTVKAAVEEVFEERKEMMSDLLEEALLDIGLARYPGRRIFSRGQPAVGIQCHESSFMNVSFRESFEKDIRVIRKNSILARIKTVIESMEAAPNMRTITGLKKLK